MKPMVQPDDGLEYFVYALVLVVVLYVDDMHPDDSSRRHSSSDRQDRQILLDHEAGQQPKREV
jgi:hypothetical protein